MDTSKYNELLESAKRYLNTRYDLLLLSLLEKLSRILGLVVLVIVAVLLAFAAFAYGGLALAFALSKVIPLWAACLIMGGVFLLLLAVAIVFRKQWFINPMVAALSAILFSPSQHKPATEEESEALARKEEDHE